MHKTRNATIKPKKIILLSFITPTRKLIVVNENEQKSVVIKTEATCKLIVVIENEQKSVVIKN